MGGKLASSLHMLVRIASLVVLLAACTTTKGTFPPKVNVTPSPTAWPEPSSTPTLSRAQRPFQDIQGPRPFPTPQDVPTPWEEMINPTLIQHVNWSRFTGQTVGAGKGSLWAYTLEYPSTWYRCPATLEYMCVQNVPLQEGTNPSEWVKFEMVWLKEPPLPEERLPEDIFLRCR